MRGIKGFFKKIGGGIKDAGKQIGKTVVHQLQPDVLQSHLSKIPIIGGGLAEANKAGFKIGQAIANKDLIGGAKGLYEAGKAGAGTLAAAESGGLLGKKK